jgi:hypothetical protein
MHSCTREQPEHPHTEITIMYTKCPRENLHDTVKDNGRIPTGNHAMQLINPVDAPHPTVDAIVSLSALGAYCTARSGLQIALPFSASPAVLFINHLSSSR